MQTTVFSQIVTEGDYFFFRTKRGQLFQILLTGSRALNISFYFPIKIENNHIKKTEHGLFKYSKFSSLINFLSLNRHWSFLLNLIPLQLDRAKGIKGRDKSERGGGGHYFKYFHQRRGIIQGRQLIKSRDGYYLRKYGILEVV